MEETKRAMILDGATDFYTLIREALELPRGDERTALLNRATERYLHEVLALLGRRREQVQLQQVG